VFYAWLIVGGAWQRAWEAFFRAQGLYSFAPIVFNNLIGFGNAPTSASSSAPDLSAHLQLDAVRRG